MSGSQKLTGKTPFTVRYWPKADTHGSILTPNSAIWSFRVSECPLTTQSGRSAVTDYGQPLNFAPLKKRRFCYLMSRSTTPSCEKH